ncbi:MAG TPA: CBS domain-containing protein [Planctomycetota bacterium]|nr:CBS domain-containing protein [Planctomycetota bacterium]
MKTATMARDLMTRPVFTLPASASVPEAARLLLSWRVSGAPVVDRHGRAIGVFSLKDLARYVRDRADGLIPQEDITLERRASARTRWPWELLEGAVVSDLMTYGMVTAFPESPIRDVVHSMMALGIHRVIVVGDGGRVEGIITSMDVLRWLDDRLRQEGAEAEPSTHRS